MKSHSSITVSNFLSSLSPIVFKIVVAITTVTTILSTLTSTNYPIAVLAKPLTSSSSGGPSSPPPHPPNTALIRLRQAGLFQDFTFPVPIPAAKSHTTVSFTSLFSKYRSLQIDRFDEASVIDGPSGFQCFLSSYSNANFFTPPRSSSSSSSPFDQSYFSSLPFSSRPGRRPPSSSPSSSTSSASSPPPPSQNPSGLRVSPTFSQDNPWPRSTYMQDTDEITCFIVEDRNTLVAWTVNQSDDNEDDTYPPSITFSHSSENSDPTTDITFINIGSGSGGIVFRGLRNVLAGALVSAPSADAECILVNSGGLSLVFSVGVPCTETLGFRTIGIQCVRDSRRMDVMAVRG